MSAVTFILPPLISASYQQIGGVSKQLMWILNWKANMFFFCFFFYVSFPDYS